MPSLPLVTSPATARRARRGNALTIALTFGVMVGFSALSVDVGLIRLARTELQVAADAGAVSGAAELDGSEEGVDRARARAVSVTEMNEVLRSPLDLAASDVVVGVWDGVGFTPWDGEDPSVVNALQVHAAPPPLASALGGAAFGVASYDLDARSMGLRQPGAPARTSRCFLPIAVPSCLLAETPPGANPAPLKFTFSPTPTDAVAWGFPDQKVGSADLRAQLEGQCGGGELEVGGSFYVDEGSHTSALTSVVSMLNGVGPLPATTWDDELFGPIPPRSGTKDTANLPTKSSVTGGAWGNTLEGPIAIVDAGADCGAAKFTGSMEVTGIAWGVIYDVSDKGSDKNLFVQLDLVNEHDVWGEEGEGSGNVLGKTEPRLALIP